MYILSIKYNMTNNTDDSLFQKSLKRALGGGVSGSLAMVTQVCSLMWVRTTMNYQYRNGHTTSIALKNLYREGGIRRFYRGLAPALVQGPLARFGDTAANAGIIYALNENPNTKNLSISTKTFCASSAAALWRICLMPIDAVKTNMQVHGKVGVEQLFSKVKTSGPRVLYHGSLAAYSATFVGHYPWFVTYNYLNAYLPKSDDMLQNLARNATIGFSSSVCSDCCSNSIRVVKTYKQSSKIPVSYPESVKQVIQKDGIIGLFGRGLKTRILGNGLQGIMFTIVFKGIEKKLNEKY